MTTLTSLDERLEQLERDAAKRRPREPLPRGLSLVQVGEMYADLRAGENSELHGVWRSLERWLRDLPAGARVVIREFVDPPPEQERPVDAAIVASVADGLPPGVTRERPEWLPNVEPDEPDEVGRPSLQLVDDDRAPGEVRAARWAETKQMLRDHKSVPGPDDGFADAVRQKRVRVSVLPFSNPTRNKPRR